MGGWTGEGKDTIIWDGTIKSKNINGTNTGDQDLSGYVPYTGATTDLTMKTHDVRANAFLLTTPSDPNTISSDFSYTGNDITIDNYIGNIKIGTDTSGTTTEIGTSIVKFPAYTTNGFLKFTNSNGTINEDTNTYLNIDQTTPQTISNGQPIFSQGLKITAGQDIRPTSNSTTAINIAQADGTDFVTFDTTNKNVGIGTSSPGEKLEVGGSIKIKIGTPILYFDGQEASGTNVVFYENAGYFYIGKYGYYNLVTFDFVNAKVGIGTGSPSEELDVVGDVEVSLDVHNLSDNGKHYFGASDDAYITFDGDSLNIKGNAVTSTDIIALQTDTVFEGSGVGFPYGSCYGNEINWTQTSAVQNTVYLISDADMTDGHLNLFTHDGSGKLTATKAGVYQITAYGDLESSIANKHVIVGIAIDGTANTTFTTHIETKFANEEEQWSFTGTFSLTANQTIEAYVKCTDTGTPNLLVNHLGIVATMIGG